MTKPEQALSTRYFSKEFPANWEVEWKAELATKYPLGFIEQIREAARLGYLSPFYEPAYMGDRPVGLQYQNLWFHYYGHQKQDRWVRDLVLVQPPGAPILVPQFKVDVVDVIDASSHNVVLREERKGGLAQAFPLRKLEKYLAKIQSELGYTVSPIGILDRERYSIFLTNRESQRNYSLVADLSHELTLGLSPSLSQVEVEYKGRDGLAANTFIAQKDILMEFDLLNSKIQEVIGEGIIQPTTTTKLDWLIDVLHL